MAIKRNVSAFINNSTEYRCAHCAYSVVSGILELFNCCITWHSPVLCMFNMSVCSGVSNLLLLSSYFMGVLSMCSVTIEGNSFSQLVSHSLSLTLPFSLAPHPHLSTTFSLFAYGNGYSWPDIQAGQCLRDHHAAGR